MDMDEISHRNARLERKIVIAPDGPYLVQGYIPLVRMSQVVSEHGEPLAWRMGESFETPEAYELCRCGQSSFRPFCDVTHCLVEFDGTEVADSGLTATRQVHLGGRAGILVRRDYSLCSEAGFCANRWTRIEEMIPHTGDPAVRAEVVAMIERCPSGSFVYSGEEDGPDLEPNLPQQIAVTTEITSSGPIDGPLWVTGYIPIERGDGRPLETRNRVTLCCCGRSENKPLCDGRHRLANSADVHSIRPLL